MDPFKSVRFDHFAKKTRVRVQEFVKMAKMTKMAKITEITTFSHFSLKPLFYPVFHCFLIVRFPNGFWGKQWFLVVKQWFLLNLPVLLKRGPTGSGVPGVVKPEN